MEMGLLAVVGGLFRIWVRIREASIESIIYHARG